MVVECGDAHAGHFCEIFDAQRLGIVGADPGDGFCRAVALISEGGNGAEASAAGSAEDAVNDFALDEVTQEWNVLRLVEQVYQAAAGIEQFGGGLAGGHAGTIRRRGAGLNFFLAEKFADDLHIEFEDETEVGEAFTGFEHVADDGQIERGEQVAGGVEDESGAGEGGALAALRDYGQAGLVGAAGRGGGCGTAAQAQAGNRGCYILSRPSKKGNFARQFPAQFGSSL